MLLWQIRPLNKQKETQKIMYAFISGTIEAKQENLVVLSNNGIGYEVFVSATTLGNLPSVGQQAKLHTYLHVREDVFMLYGFADLKEKQMFLDLMTVSGIGAKMALQILSGVSVSELLSAIAGGDVKLLSSIKGVGKKTAERIVLELKGGLRDLQLADMFTTATNTSPANEAVEVLVSMGIQRITALQLVKALALPTDSTETIISKCLKNM